MINKKQTKKEYSKEWYNKNKEEINKNRKEDYQHNKEEINMERRKHYKENKEKFKMIRDKPENKERVKVYNQRPEVKERSKNVKKEYSEKNKDKIKERKRKWNQENKERIREQHKDYYERNREERREKIREYIKKRYEENPNFKMTTTLRNRFRKALNLYSTTGKIMKSREYGIDYSKIVEHLKPFPKDIKNYEVDHIIPVSWFDLNNPKEIEWAFAPENHQWMLRTENRKKSAKFIKVVEI